MLCQMHKPYSAYGNMFVKDNFRGTGKEVVVAHFKIIF
jgi:hypothetical protein